MASASRADPRLDAALRRLAPDGVLTGTRRITAADVAELRPVEAAAVAAAVPARRRELATGRALLRALLGSDVAIPVGPDRAPVLPAGVAASIAHDRDVAVAAVALGRPLVLGIDVEPATPLTGADAAVVLRRDDDVADAHLAFTLKEAAYKAWSRRGGRLLDHHDVRVRVDAVDGGRFEAEVAAEGVVLAGRFTAAAGRWLALVVADA